MAASSSCHLGPCLAQWFFGGIHGFREDLAIRRANGLSLNLLLLGICHSNKNSKECIMNSNQRRIRPRAQLRIAPSNSRPQAVLDSCLPGLVCSVCV